KDSNLYMVNRDSMGGFNSSANKVYQELAGVFSGGIWSMPAYFNNRLYFGQVGHPIYAFQLSNAKISTGTVAQTVNSFGFPGATPSISANNNSNGIVWATENTNPAVLHAYDANTLNEIYNSSQAAGNRDNFGAGNKFITPTIAFGKVYVATTNGVGVFGLFNPGVAAPVFAPPPGPFSTPQSVTISDTTTGVSIYYTTDGSHPTTSSPAYSSAIPVSVTTTINAIAVAGAVTSTVTTGVYAMQYAPTGLAATAVSTTGINLTWTNNSPTATAILVENSTDNVTFTQIASLAGNAAAYSNTGLTASTLYYYRVRAQNAAGTSAYCNTSSATTLSLPAAPSALAATAVSSTGINLTWTNNSPTATAMLVENSTNNVTFTQIASLAGNAAAYSNTGLTAGTLYYYRVRAQNAAG